MDDSVKKQVESLRARKKRQKLSYAVIAERSGVPLSTVQKVLGGITENPRFETLKALEQALSEAQYEETTSSYEIQKVREVLPPLSRGGKGSAGKNGAYARQGAYTVDDYYAMPPRSRVELIDGMIYDLPPQEPDYQFLISSVYYEIRKYIETRGLSCLPIMAPFDVRLDCDNATMVVPDLFVVFDRSKAFNRSLVGAPDFVLEVVHPASREVDLLIKPRKYREAGVREYWAVNPAREQVYVYTFEEEEIDLQIYSLDEEVPVRVFAGDLRVPFAAIREAASAFTG